ncbi:MAG: redox-sensing transcriptional repressor Rex [Phycisphaerales bacterium]|jgi:redox-sensing transcriptional repressor
MSPRPRIPRPTAARVSVYLRELEVRLERGDRTVRSREIGESLGLTDAQVRKDLRALGLAGHPGVGYPIDETLNRLRGLAGTDRGWKVALVGAGNIGKALMSYTRFEDEGFRIAAVFDADPAKTGLRIGGLRVEPMSRLAETIAAEGIRLGIVATPIASAQQAADALVAAGIEGLLNFAPRRLELPTSIATTEVDLSMSLMNLALQVRLVDGVPIDLPMGSPKGSSNGLHRESESGSMESVQAP